MKTRMWAAIAAIVLAATLTPSAAASSGPRQWSFTRPVSAASTQPSTSPYIGGEPKNQPPFTGPVQAIPTVVVRSANAFDWSDAGVGLAAGIGLTLTAAGLLAGIARGRARTAGHI